MSRTVVKGYGDKPRPQAASVSSSGSSELKLDHERDGKQVVVTARRGDELLHVEKLDVLKSTAREKFSKVVSAYAPEIETKAVQTELMRIAAELQRAPEKELADDPPPPTPEKLLFETPDRVKAEARQMLEDPNLAKRIIDDVQSLGVAGERELILSIYHIGTSRLLPRPLAGMVQSQSSSGKSHVIEKTSLCFPPESLIHATAMTPQSLYHMPPESLVHRFVVAGERSRLENDDTAEASRALREMLSAGRLSKLMPVKEGGEIVTKMITQAGPVSYVESTTLVRVFDEDVNRMIVLQTDERPTQTRNILATLAAQFAGSGPRIDPEATIARHHALQRMLQQRPVVVPFAGKLADGFSAQRVEARRAFPHLLSMIQASALLHQFQRKVDGDGRIIATADDYAIARHLMAVPLARSLGGRISDAAIRFHERLTEWAAEREKFSTTEAVNEDHVSDRAIRGWLRELAEAGAVEQVEDRRGNKPATWRLTGMRPDELAGCELPTVESIAAECDFRHSDST
jgi:hypothetical protein